MSEAPGRRSCQGTVPRAPFSSPDQHTQQQARQEAAGPRMGATMRGTSRGCHTHTLGCRFLLPSQPSHSPREEGSGAARRSPFQALGTGRPHRGQPGPESKVEAMASLSRSQQGQEGQAWPTEPLPLLSSTRAPAAPNAVHACRGGLHSLSPP